jgi:rhamnogalacturonan endolyase
MRSPDIQKLKALSLIIMVTCMMAPLANAANAPRVVEKLDRGLIAVKSGSGYFLSWRLFGTDPQDNIFGFNVYKGTTRLNTSVITNATCYQDNSSGTDAYTVKPVTNGVEGTASEAAIVLSTNYLNIPLTPPGSNTANDCSIGDLDGDGQYEIVLKWDAVNAQDNSNSGVTDNVFLDGYKLNGTKLWRIDLGKNIRAGAHYTQFLVYDFDGDGMAEVACKTAPGTKDGSGNYLKLGPAAGANNTTKYANSNGYILSGPEWYTIFSGKTGLELVTVNYKPPRYGTLTPTPAQIKAEWGDDYGNRVDRFLASVAYLDGQHPSLVPCRGYYTRTTLWALDWRNGKLTERWYFDTDSTGTGKDGKAHSTYTGQGCHSLRQGDVDGDGFDEIVYGSCTIDHDGKGLYNTRLGHGDALHLTDMDPNRTGLEVWQVHETPSSNGGIAASFRDAKTGANIWTDAGSTDNGRGCCGPITSGIKGWQMWSGAGGLWDVSHKSVGGKPGSTNFTMWWGADLTRSTEDGTSISPGLSTTGMASNNGTKSTPCLTADIFGDWREELVLRTSNNNALHIYTTTTPTTNRLYTLMHDPVYRTSVAVENVAYNQPPEPGIYIGPGMTLPQVKPNIIYPDGSGTSSAAISSHLQKQVAATLKAYADRAFVLPGVAGVMKTVTVYDLLGKSVAHLTATGNAVLLADHGISRGVYLVKIRDRIDTERP